MMPARKDYGTYIKIALLMFFIVMTVRPVDFSLTRSSDMTISFTLDICNISSTVVHSKADMPFINECLYFLIIMPICVFIALEKVFRYLVIGFPIEHPPEGRLKAGR